MSWRGSRRSQVVKTLTFAALLSGSVAGAQTTDVALGIEALARRDVRGADALFARGTQSPNPLIRPAAWQWRGHVAWKFRGNLSAAGRYLDSALATARDSSQILLEVARLEGARHRYHDAVRTGYLAMSKSLDAERRGLAAREVVALAVDGVFSSPDWVFEDSVDQKVIAEVRDTMLARVGRFHGRTSDARALIDAAAIVADSIAIRKGLDSYLALTDPGTAGSVSRAASMADALARARMYESAVIFKRAVESAAQGDIVAHGIASLDLRYAQFLRELRHASDSIYRATIARTARAGDVQRAVTAAGRRLWPALQTYGGRGDFYPAALYRELDRLFGTAISVERGRGADELYLAHRLGASSLNGAILIVLDGVVVDGIDDWLLDGTGGRAGWVAHDTIYERRTAFTEAPFRALVALTDPQTMPGERFRITRDSIGDIDRARRDSLGYFPGVAARMFRSGAQALLDSVKTPEAFTRAMHDNLVQTSIVLHESRHAADARTGRASTQEEDEFRAKIDEVTGAPLPRLSLTAILTPNIGGSSPHGRANLRVMIGLNRWIRRNGGAIANYAAKTPALLQLPKLTDAQLRAAFESMRVK